MALNTTGHSQNHSSFLYRELLGDMKDAEHVLANQAAAVKARMAPDGYYMNGRDGTDLQAFQSERFALESRAPNWESMVPSDLALLRSRIAHSPINLPVDGLGFPIRVEDGPVIRANKGDPFPYNLN